MFVNHSENSIKSDDITRCNSILSDFGLYIGYDSGSDIYPTIKVYQKILTNTSYELVLLDDIDFNVEFLVGGGERRLDFILSNLDTSKITNTFIFQKNTPSYEKFNIDPSLVEVDIDRSINKFLISGKISNIIGYLTILLRTNELSQKVWGFNNGEEVFLPKFRIGDLVSPKREVFEMRVIGYSLGPMENELLYNCLIPDSRFPEVISLMSEGDLQYSRSHKIGQILNN